MRRRTPLAMGCVVALAVVGRAQSQPPTAPMPQTVAPDIPGVVAGGTKVQLIKDGFDGSDCPIALSDGSVLFVENAGNRVVHIDKADQTSVFLDNALTARAITMDRRGRLIGIQTAGHKIGVIYPKGSEAVILEQVDGKPLVGPNDLIADSKGGIYVTDPGPYDLPPGAPPFPGAVIYIPPSGKPMKVAGDIQFPNGLALSADEKTLFVNASKGDSVLAYDVQPDGGLAHRRSVGKYSYDPALRKDFPYIGDGLVVDNQNRLYVALPPGVQVFSPKGELLGTIPIPRRPQNMVFAGPDKKTLYVVGRGAAFKIQMLSRGVPGRPK